MSDNECKECGVTHDYLSLSCEECDKDKIATTFDIILSHRVVFIVCVKHAEDCGPIISFPAEAAVIGKEDINKGINLLQRQSFHVVN